MPFRTRNPYYLRISEKNVLPLYLYLDERHLDWMSDLILQHVLSDLRPHILPKLKAEADLHSGSGHASSKKATVDTHRGETYQFCYFIRKTEPHSVVVKTRMFVAAPPQKRLTMPPPPVPPSKAPRQKRKAAPAKDSPQKAKKKQKTKGKGKASQTEEIEISSSDEDYSPDQALGQRRLSSIPVDVRNAEGLTNPDMMDVDVAQAHEATIEPASLAMELDLQPEEEEEKPKPMLQLQYQGYSIYGHCLCVVVEPWPSIRSVSRAPSVVQTLSRAPSIVPPNFAPTGPIDVREKTPLFLPDYDSDRERSETPAPFRGQRDFPTIPGLDDTSFFDDSDDSDDGGMMEFSQILSATGEYRAGAVDDDEDMDTSIFFGDADEAREL